MSYLAIWVRGKDRRGSLVDMTSIQERPAEVEGRQVPGHWEGDLIKGAGNRSAVGTLVERKSRYVVVGPDARQLRPRRRWKRSHGTEHVLRRPAQSLATAQQRKRQRPDSESLLPKSRDLSGVSQAELKALAKLLNNRPRKCLDFETPAEVFLRDIINSINGVALQT